MESGSSGSFQSSSGGVGGGGGGGGGGGDEEYDSRGEPMSSFLNSQQQMFLSYHQQNPPFFHPSSDHHHSQNLGASIILQNENFQEQYNNNEQMGWSRGLMRPSEGNYGNFGNFSSTVSASSSLPSSSNQTGLGRMMNQNQVSPASLLQPGGGSGGGGADEAINNPITAGNQPPPPPNAGATKSTNPKKRTRASRRAPTTVLTTDTTNFRQMVQEFTGIPAAPFSANPGGASFGRRLDLFGPSGAASMRGGHQLDHLSSLYPLRPSPHKLTHLLGGPSSSSSSPSLLSSSLIMNAIGNPNSNNNASISNNTLGLPQHLKQPPPHQNLLTMQNQLLNFQPLVQSSLSPSIFNTAPRPHHQESSSMNNNPPSLDELGSFLNQQRNSGEVERQSSWRDDQGGRNLNNEGQDGQHQLGGTFDGNVTQHDSNINSGFKLNSSSSSDFNPDKVLDNASSSAGLEFTNFK